MHLPSTAKREYLNSHGDNLQGFRFSYNRRATPLMEWSFDGVTLSDADAAELVDFWEDVEGGYGEFDFTDPDTATNYARCRFIGNDLTIRRVGYNENTVSISWKELV